jgi:iron complex outermembrane receptor protein
MAFPSLVLLGGHALAAEDSTATLPGVTVTDTRTGHDPSAAGIQVGADALVRMRAATRDTAQLLGDVPGVSASGGGAVSSLPVIHGLADDRLRIKVDGMDLVSACANHMNPPLSYIDPTRVGSIQVISGITPVSLGGDSIGGAIVVNSPAPEFARSGEGILRKGEAGAFYRSNGNARGGHAALTVANEKLSVSYSGSSSESGNYEAAEAFKASLPASQTATTVAVPGAKEVGSSQYKAINQSLAVALRHEAHLLELRLGLQNIPYQGFPNQRMDMTGNQSDQVNLRYSGQYEWGALEARVYNENTRHKMNLLDNKLQTNNPAGMPMDTDGKNTGVLVKADVPLSQRDTLTVGGEYQRYRLNDWWDPISPVVAMPFQGMKGVTFWNINDGQRDRFDLFAEWAARWSPQWLSQFGVRSGTVRMNTGPVNGYNTVNYPTASYADFNAADRSRTDSNIDLSALARYTPSPEQSVEFGYARKNRSPNLYERYTWSTNNTMVMNMINWFGDANGFVGNLNLKPETANTVSATAKWNARDAQEWGLQLTPYFTYVENYIDAVPCAVVGKTCPARTDGFVNLSFDNQSARIYGLDLSGFQSLGQTSHYGRFTASGMLSYVRGENATTDDNLYNMMPLNAKLALVQRLGGWSNTVEVQLVDAKTDVSKVRNEVKTAGYGLLNLRSSYEIKAVRLDFGIENVLNRFYAPPLGGAYVGEGNVMGGGATWGIPVPGMGRSVYAAVTMKF